MDFRHCQILDPVGDAVAFPKSIEFWKDRRIPLPTTTTTVPHLEASRRPFLYQGG